VRRLLIQRFLPLVFCSVPVVAGLVIAAAIPAAAMRDYLKRLPHSPMDWLILSIGFLLLTAQTLLAWQALQWRISKFDERPDRWLSQLAQAAEWFPLLGLLGTVGGILQTFGSMENRSSVTPREIIQTYAPAITATGSGLFMALVNILPTWMVVFGRDLILTLSGVERPPDAGSKT
jgi:hypothetical protein